MKTSLKVWFLAFALGGCSGPGGLGVQAKAVTTERAGHVAAYLSVSEGGEPAPGLSAEDFTVYENGLALSHEQTQLVLLDKSKAVVHHTLLLVDESGAANEEVKAEIQLAIGTFVEQVRSTQDVSVYAYDGGPTLRLVAEFSRATRTTPPVAVKNLQLKPKDRSRNLLGALVLAEEELTRRLEKSRKTLKVGTLVVFSAGPDLAGRVSRAEAQGRLRATPHTVLGISFAEQPSGLREYAKSGYFEGFAMPVLALAFEDVGQRVRSLYDQEYLISYCSPARSGQRELRIEARLVHDDGSEKKGGVSSSFDADGFSGDCDPNSLPRFQLATAR